ncbi:MAG: PASTA domain-containing protein [Herpetosiphonaceae bacterium]|nr:PASTA domain-containing protein [Herpetosiphonaceae bacterium]
MLDSKNLKDVSSGLSFSKTARDAGLPEKLDSGQKEKAEAKHGLVAGIFSIVYLLLMLAFFSWQLFDTWIGAHTLIGLFGYSLTRLNTPTFHLIAFTMIGGALGAIVNGIRSFLRYSNGFASRHTWKYITAPWMGGVLALLVYALIHSSTAVFSGSTTTDGGSAQLLANFAAAALAGYGSRDVFIWLDAQVEKLFKVPQGVPNVIGKPEEPATDTLHDHNLAKGATINVPRKHGEIDGTVVAQSPSPNEITTRDAEVDLVVATSVSDKGGVPLSQDPASANGTKPH